MSFTYQQVNQLPATYLIDYHKTFVVGTWAYFSLPTPEANEPLVVFG